MKLRLLTAFAGIPLVLGAVFCTKPWPFLVVLLAVMAIALYELNTLFPADNNRWTRCFAIPITFAVSYLSTFGWGRLFVMPLMFILGLVWALSLRRNRDVFTFALASLWITLPIFSLWILWFQNMNHSDMWRLDNRILMVLFPLWAGDSAGIFVGKYFGKHLLAPSISPKKTWEGAGANFVASIALALVTGHYLGLSPSQSTVCGLICGVFGQAGDLFESALKRSVGAKDSGSILPGHGGILDRIDSILFAAPLVMMTLQFAF